MKMRQLTITNIAITIAVFIGNYFYQSLGFSYPIKIMFAVGFILFFPYIVFDVVALKYVVLTYAVIISIMVGKSVGNAIRSKRTATYMIMAGSLLFFISDMMLLLAWFSSIEGRWTSNVCMAAYYPGLCLLAASMVAYMKEEK